MQQYLDLLGETVTDKVTGITGVVTSVSFDLYGCVMAIIKPPIDKDGKSADGRWYDVKRLDVKSGKKVMQAPKFATMQPGTENGPASKPVPD